MSDKTIEKSADFPAGSNAYSSREVLDIQEVAQHTAGLFAELPPEDRDDIQQQVALVLCEKRDEIGDQKALAYRIARNTAIDWLRRERNWRNRRILFSALGDAENSEDET